ncbi:MAG: folylpolyglutamate synthase/dihydrofolate synthase family protein [Anaerolineales bacterium]
MTTTQHHPRYQETLDFLYTFIDYSLQRNFRMSPEKFNLARMEALLARLGNPHLAYPVIHIAGTKGKGSVAAMCASALQAAGYRVGLYTSPHLVEYTERIRLDGREISSEDLVALVDEIRPHLAAIPEITTFEITTALAFWYFARSGATAAVIEVGLGGRLDATNVVTPLVSVITSLSYDHAEILGDTLAKIAGEKAGIIKPGHPIVLAPQRMEAYQAVAQIAAQRAAPLIEVGRDWLYAQDSHTLDGQSFLVWRADEQPQVNAFIESGGLYEWEPTRLSIPLLGHHQVQNAATAYAALQTARGEGLALREDDIRRGFAQTVWQGRFEVLQRYPPVVIDSAHNRDSALKLRLALDDYFPGQPVILLYGASEDKDIPGMFAELLPRVRRVIATQSTHPRAANSERLVALAHQAGCSARSIPDFLQAFAVARQIAAQQQAVLLVTGSIFIAAAARQVWAQSFELFGVSHG